MSQVPMPVDAGDLRMLDVCRFKVPAIAVGQSLRPRLRGWPARIDPLLISVLSASALRSVVSGGVVNWLTFCDFGNAPTSYAADFEAFFEKDGPGIGC